MSLRHALAGNSGQHGIEPIEIAGIPGQGNKSFAARPIAAIHKRVVLQFADRLTDRSNGDPVLLDIAELLKRIVSSNYYLQVPADTKAGTSAKCGFIGSDEFYLGLRHSRYAALPSHFSALDCGILSFIICDELLHEALHILFLAQAQRGAAFRPHTYFAEELSVVWWSAQALHLVFGRDISRSGLLQLADDFLLCERNASHFQFWQFGCVFASFYQRCTWLGELVAYLPQRNFYIGERPDILEFYGSIEHSPSAQFLFDQPAGHLRMALRAPTLSLGRGETAN